MVPDSYCEDQPPRQQLSYGDTATDVSGDQNSAGRYWEPPPDRRDTLNSDPDAFRMYYERRRQNTGPPPFGRGRSATINYNTAGAASGPQSRQTTWFRTMEVLYWYAGKPIFSRPPRDGWRRWAV